MARLPRFPVFVLFFAVLAVLLTLWWLSGDTARPGFDRPRRSEVPAPPEPAEELPPDTPAPRPAPVELPAELFDAGIWGPSAGSAGMSGILRAGAAETVALEPLPPGQEAGLRGQVVDDEGLPLLDVEVVVVRAVTYHGLPVVGEELDLGDAVARTTSGGDGSFLLEELDPRLRYELVFLPASEHLSHRMQAPTLRSGEVVEVGKIRLARPGRIEGIAQDGHGRPLAGVRVKVGEPTFARNHALRGSWSDEGGRFLLAGVRPGEHLVSARLEGYRDARVEPVTVRAGETAGPLRLVLEAGYTLVVQVSDPVGRPIAGAGLWLSEPFFASPFRGGDAEPKQRTDVTGRAVFGNLDEPAVTLTVFADGFAQTSASLRLTPGEHLHTLTLVPAGGLRGRVVDPSGAPLDYARVDAWADGSHLGQRGTRAGGSFRFGHLPPGLVRLEIAHDRYADGSFGPFVLTGDALLEVGDLRLEEAGSIAVLVVDPAGVPQPSVELTVGLDARPTVQSLHFDIGPDPRTDADGRALLTGIEPGLRTVRARKGERSAFSAPVEVRSGGQAEARVVLGAVGRVEGTARDADGKPCPDFPLHLVRDGFIGTSVGATRSDGEGKFHFARVPPGSYVLSGGPEAHRGPVFTVAVGGTTRQDYEVARVRVRGQLLTADGRPAAARAVVAGRIAIGAGGVWTVRRAGGSGYTDEEGRFDLELVRGAAPGLEVGQGDARVVFPLAEPFDGLVLQLPSEDAGRARLRGTLRGVDGATGGAQVSVERVDGPPGAPAFRRELLVGAEGGFVFEALPVGTHRLEVRRPGASHEVRVLALEAGETEVELHLYPAGFLQLVVDSAAGHAGPVTVEARLADAPDATRVLTGSLGAPLHFEGLRRGATCSLTIDAPGHARRVVQQVIGVDTSLSVQLTLD